MSLKAFHIVFVIVSGLLCIGLCAWSFAEYRRTQSSEFVWGIVVSVLGLVALSLYGRWFLKKLRGVSYL